MRADLGAEPVLERRDDAAAVGVVLGVGAGDDEHVERQPQRVAAHLDVALLHHVEHRHLDALGEVGQLVDGDDAAVRPWDQAVGDGLGVAEAAALGHLDGVDVADEVGDAGVRGGQLLGVALAAVQPRDRQVVAATSAARRIDSGVMGVYGCSLSSEPSITGVHSSSRPVSARSRRVLPCPRSPSRTRSCPAISARSSCGRTVSSKPKMPGQTSRPSRQRGQQVLPDFLLHAALAMTGGAELAERCAGDR